MTRLASLVARTVMRSALAEDISITMAGTVVSCRGSWSMTEDDATFLSVEHVVTDSIVRIPASSLPGDPKVGDPISVGGQPFFVINTWRREPVWLVEVSKRRPS